MFQNNFSNILRANKISHLPGIEVELCGTWLWVSGKTRAVKNELKAAGFKWSRSKKKWSFHVGGFRKRTKREFRMNEIRSKYGSIDMDIFQLKQVAG